MHDFKGWKITKEQFCKCVGISPRHWVVSDQYTTTKTFWKLSLFGKTWYTMCAYEKSQNKLLYYVKLTKQHSVLMIKYSKRSGGYGNYTPCTWY